MDLVADLKKKPRFISKQMEEDIRLSYDKYVQEQVAFLFRKQEMALHRKEYWLKRLKEKQQANESS